MEVASLATGSDESAHPNNRLETGSGHSLSAAFREEPLLLGDDQRRGPWTYSCITDGDLDLGGRGGNQDYH